MNKVSRLLIAFFLLAVAFPALAQTTGTVASITDGDTVVLRNGDKIRLACIDAPELGQTWGGGATARLRELIPPGAAVQIVEVDKDRYGRTVAVVFSQVNGRQTNVNLQMVREGYAVVYEKYLDNCPGSRDELLAAEASAKEQRLNFWGQVNICLPWDFRRGNCGNDQRIGCDPSYPDICIPPFPPDLNCGSIPHRRFRVRGNDPHGFDGDGDGVGCEG